MNNSSNEKKLLVGTGIYAVGTFGTKILMFLIAPLYTYYLIPSEMGTYDVLISAIGLLIPVISLQISDAVYRWIIRDDVDCSAYLTITYQFLIVSSMVVASIIVIINHFFAVPYVYYFLGALFSALFFQISQKILRGLKQQWLFAISGIIYTVFFLALNVVQLCILHRGVESLLVSYIVANIIGIATIIMYEKRIRFNLFGKPDLMRLKELLWFSIPLIPNYLSWWIIDSSDRFIVLWALGMGSNGILAIAHKFPTILQSVFGLFLNSWQDLAISNDKSDCIFFTSVFQKLYKLTFTILWIVIPVTKLFVWVVMGTEYKIACNYIPFYYLGTAFQVFSSFYGVGYLRSKNTRGAFYSSIYGALINVAVNIGVIRLVGLQAAAISTFVAFLLMWLIRVKHNKKELGIAVEWKIFILLFLSDVFLCLISIAGDITINGLLAVGGTVCFLLFAKKDLATFLNNIKRC